MSIKYKSFAKTNPRNPHSPSKFYASASKGDLTASIIKGEKLHIRPGKEFQDTLNAINFEKAG